MKSLYFQLYRLSLVRDGDLPTETISNPNDAAAALGNLLTDADREHFVAVALDARNQIIGANVVSIGSLSASIVHPRELMKFAINANAASIILAHNHPSGDISPSKDDIEMTLRMVRAAEIMGIEILDHLILAHGGYYFSLKEKGLMPA